MESLILRNLLGQTGSVKQISTSYLRKILATNTGQGAVLKSVCGESLILLLDKSSKITKAPNTKKKKEDNNHVRIVKRTKFTYAKPI